jgi:hypothetical protein
MMKRRIQSERGAALIFALMGMTVLMALGAALVLITSTETVIAGNFRNGRQAFYAAEAAVELAIAELREGADWTAIVQGAERSRFVDGVPDGSRALPTDAPVDLTALRNLANCNTPVPCGGATRWHLFAYGPLGDFVSPGDSTSPFYVVAFVSEAPGVGGELGVTIRAEAFGPKGARQALEVTMSRTAAGHPVVVRTVLA